MLLVVYYHVNLFMGKGSSLSDAIWDTALFSFTLPLFFFISGYIAYRAVEWTPKNYIISLFKKAQALLVPTCVFSILYSITFYSHVQLGVACYWFTIVLFEFFLIYYTVNLIARKYDTLKFILLIVLACTGGMLFAFNIGQNWAGYIPLSLDNVFQYFQFFVLGIIAQRYNETTKKILSSSLFNSVIILIFVVSLVLMGSTNVLDTTTVKTIVRPFIVRYAGLLVVLSLFYRYKNYFAENGRISSILQCIGCHTLDIYMLHYFFIDFNSTIAVKIHNLGSLPLEIFCIGALALMNIALCLLLSQCIRNSKFLAKYLFGAKTA